MRTPTLSQAAIDALRGATVTPTSVKLNGQIERDVYQEVNKVLTRIGGGGKWNRGQGVHLFPYDPTVELASLIYLGRMPADKDKDLSFFRTPDDVADLMVDSSFVQEGATILEPSAGDGQIVRAIYRKHPFANVECVEIDERRATFLTALGFRVAHQPFQHYSEACGRFHNILMNPPFTTPGDHLAWLTHIELALTLLRPGGRLVAIAPAGLIFRSGARFEALRELVGDDYTELPREAFKTSGTTILTVMIEILSASGGSPLVRQPEHEQLSLFA
jgi:hypothetical protein